MENNIEIKFEKIEVTKENMKKLLNEIGQLKWELSDVKYWENYYKNRVKFWLNENDKEIMNQAIYSKVLFGETKVCHATMLARRGMIQRTGSINEDLKIFEDMEWLYRIYFKYNVDISHCLENVYVMRRMHPDGMAYTRRTPENLAAVLKITDQYMREKIRRDLLNARKKQSQ